MASIEIFHYTPGDSFLHTMDERIKILLVLCMSTIITVVDAWGLLLFAVPIVIAFIGSGIRIRTILRELRAFSFFIILVFVFHIYSVQGGSLLFSFFPVPPAMAFLSGSVIIVRILYVLSLGVLLSSTSKIVRLVSAAHSLLSKIPFIPASSIATIMGLTLKFIPELIDTWQDVSDSLKARCAERIKNPAKRIAFSALPLFIHIFVRADEVSDAMEARCYNDDYTAPLFRIRTRDWIVFATGIVFCAGALIVSFIVR
jgi:energy-coupling factor transport system permease protein